MKADISLNMNENSEELREVLLTVEGMRQREEAARIEAEALLSGLHVLTSVQAVEQMFLGILRVIREVAPFTEAAILLEDDRGRMRIAAASSDKFHFVIARRGKLFGRVLNGEAAAVADLTKIAEWAPIAEQLSDPYLSALMAPLQTLHHRAMLLCVHHERAFFSRAHLMALKTFSPLAAQALQRSQQLEDLNGLVSRLDFIAHHDGLTGLPNRTAFRTHLSEALEDAQRGGPLCGLFLIDLDHFKQVNDTYGHPAGDDLLKEAAFRLRQVAGSGFAARISGDEFAIVVRVQDATGIGVYARALMEKIKQSVRADGNLVDLSLSAGLALGPAHGTTSDELISNADLALYRAKREQRGTLCYFEPVLDQARAERRALEGALQRALVADEFRIAYQPQVCLRHGSVIGYEALVRWHDPKFGLRMPDAFIPIAEKAGLICRLGEWVLARACADAALWPEPLRVAVNLSAAQFVTGDLDEIIAHILRRTRLPSHRLEVEVTESLLITDSEKVQATLERIQARGVLISIDDFGTGFSSLNYLASLKFDKIKIDRSFVARLGKEKRNDVIVSAILGLGRSLDVPIIAEGIETEAQCLRLAAMGCQFGQGYLFGRPKPLEEIGALDNSGWLNWGPLLADIS
jgi:diguanylate cyclase (GGDEF)-like protein